MNSKFGKRLQPHRCIQLLLLISFVHMTFCKSSSDETSFSTTSSSHTTQVSSTTSSPKSSDSVQPLLQQPQTTQSQHQQSPQQQQPTFITNLNIRCDYSRYYGTGCPDHQSTICDPKRMECVCRSGSIVIEGRCMTIKTIDEHCFSSKECEQTSGAKCINQFGEVESLSSSSRSSNRNKGQDSGSESVSSSSGAMGPLISNSPNIYVNLNAGICQCPSGLFYHQEKGRCIKRVIRSSCHNDTECYSRQHSFCDLNQHICSCDDGYSLDTQSDQCRPMILTSILTSSSHVPPESRGMNPPGAPHATPLCEYGLMYDQSFRKCVPIIHWENNRTWSALVWKVAVLCVVLVLIMMLASGIQRARQNENLLNWSRALELYAARGPGTTDSTLDLESGGTRVIAASGSRAVGVNRVMTSSSSGNSSSSGILDASSLLGRDGVLLVLPSGMPPPPPAYSALPVVPQTIAVVSPVTELSSTTDASAAILPTEDPPSYEEAIRVNHSSANRSHTHRSHLITDRLAVTSSTTSLSCGEHAADIIDADK